MSTIKRKQNSNQIIVNSKSSFKSHLVKCQRILDNIHYDTLVINAMGKATPRALNLALQLNENNFHTFDLKPRTYSVDICEDKSMRPVIGADKDGFNPDAIDITNEKITHVPAIEIVVRKHELEIKKMRKFQQSNKNRKSISG